MSDLALFAQQGLASGLVHWVIVAILVAGVIGVAVIVIRESGVVIPAFLIRIGWIVLVVVIGVIAVKFLAEYL